MYSFSYLEPVCCSMSSSNCCFLICIQISQEAGQVVWYSHLFQNFPQLIVIHIVKGFGSVNKAEVDVFILAFLVIQWILAIWSLVLLLFLNPVWTSRSSQFMYCWRLAWINYFGSMWDECKCVVAEHSLKSPFFGIAIETAFPIPCHCWDFQIC